MAWYNLDVLFGDIQLIKEENGKYIVYSEEGKRLSRHFSSKEEAEKRLNQIEYFKHADQELDQYKGKEVLLNSPIETPDKETKYQVYTRNTKGDIVSVRFNGEPTPIQSKDTATPAYWNEFVSGASTLGFIHKPFFDTESKRIRSVRDGVQTYLGIELGIEPYNKEFTVYRSPETIAEISRDLDGLPITNDHVDVDDASQVQTKDIVGSIKGSEIIEFIDDTTDSSLYIENDTAMDERGIALKESGKKEFSLGYRGRLKPHRVYDFEQFAFKPTHLALVDSARGGSVLTFVDKKETDMGDKALLKVFLDAEGNPNLEQIVEIAQELPTALKKIPMDKLSEVIPMLQEIVSMSGGEAPPMEDEESVDEESVNMDQDYEDMESEDKEKFEDSKLFKSIVESISKPFADSQEFKDAVADSNKTHAAVIEKAVDFVKDDYIFADKSTEQIMRDALASEHGSTNFEDAELSTAFKLLKRSDSSLRNFGGKDGKSALEARIEKSLEG